MPKKSTQPKTSQRNQPNNFQKLPFYSPNPSKADKAQIAEKLRTGSIALSHLEEIGREGDWLKWRWDSENGVWLIIHSFTPTGYDAPIGLVSYRAKKLANGLAMAIWYFDELSESDFAAEDDDDF